MTTFRASSGNTSSGVTFWLIAAMRKKERTGPGMAANSAGAERSSGTAFGERELFGRELCGGTAGGAPDAEFTATTETQNNTKTKT
jgi:hypothetical protein